MQGRDVASFGVFEEEPEVVVVEGAALLGGEHPGFELGTPGRDLDLLDRRLSGKDWRTFEWPR